MKPLLCSYIEVSSSKTMSHGPHLVGAHFLGVKEQLLQTPGVTRATGNVLLLSGTPSPEGYALLVASDFPRSRGAFLASPKVVQYVTVFVFVFKW